MSEIEELFQRIDTAKAQLDAMRPLDREREQRLMQKFRLWWTYHSNAIEGNSLTQGETEMFLMEGLTAKGKPLKDHLDLRGHSNAVNYLLAFVRDKEVLTEAVIRELHKVLLIEPYRVEAITSDGLPTMKTVALGEYKSQPNHVRTPTGETHFYATPEDTPAKMYDLIEWYRGEVAKGAMHLVEIAARFHHRFTAIHPFDDGNGRMARLLMNLLLMQWNYPPVIIRHSERKQYLAALQRADAREEKDFIVFVGEHIVESLDLSLRAANGEEISEPSDIEKEIALEVLRFKTSGTVKSMTRESQENLFEESIDPLFSEVTRLLLPLCALFDGSSCLVQGLYKSGSELKNILYQFPLTHLSKIPRDDPAWQEGNIIKKIDFLFLLKSFTKGRFNSFDLSANLQIIFESTGFKLNFQPQQLFSAGHISTYESALSKEEIRKEANQVARFFLESIQKETGEKS